MLTIEISFPAGRYHATPWGRNVNEGDPEWPPSPYRLARALIDIQKRRRPDWPQNRLEAILNAISGYPCYVLPRVAPNHIKAFMSSNEKDIFAKQLIFDPFVAIDRSDRLLITFDTDAAPEMLKDLSELLGLLNYLGRSESWVSMKCNKEVPSNDWNCMPSETVSDNGRYESMRLACLVSVEEYDRIPFNSELSWFEALCLSTNDLHKDGWSNPPAMTQKNYSIKHELLEIKLTGSKAFGTKRHIRSVMFALHSPVLPDVRETVRFAERVRANLMGIHRRVQGGNPDLVSPQFSGKTDKGRPLEEGHSHAFFLPLDEDGDGQIDHFAVISREPFSSSELEALDLLSMVRRFDGRPDIHMIPVSSIESMHRKTSRTWVSVNPMVTARHYRKGRGSYEEWLIEQIMHECKNHHLSKPAGVNLIPWTMAGARPIRWMEFARGKKNEDPFRGFGCILHFNEPVDGPFALGARSHFGLGLFQPLS